MKILNTSLSNGYDNQIIMDNELTDPKSILFQPNYDTIPFIRNQPNRSLPSKNHFFARYFITILSNKFYPYGNNRFSPMGSSRQQDYLCP